MKRNKLIFCPEDVVQPILDGIIVKDTMNYSSVKAGRIFLPETDRMDFDKQVEVGEVVAIGSNVDPDEVAVGDTVLYRRLTAFWLPNGLDQPNLWKIEHPFSLLAVIPKGSPPPIEYGLNS